MKKQKVVSREYKVMLQEERFIGSRSRLLERAAQFWDEFTTLIEDAVLDIDGSLDVVAKDRTVRFYDGADDRLRASHYVCRERIDHESEEREITLKFRHPDLYLSRDRNMDAADRPVGKTKFEEDIKFAHVAPGCSEPKPTRISLYSFSTKQEIDTDLPLPTMNAIGDLYPGLRDGLSTFRANEPLAVVGRDGGFTARELVILGDDKRADFRIGNDPDVEAECALIVWYDVRGDMDRPVVVEFSFRYGDDDDQYDGAAARRALDVFELLPATLPEWIEMDGLTKTAYVYSRR